MSNGTIDLRGNTNFVVLKNLLHQPVVPRTNLAAVDLTVANGLAVTGSTMYVNLATADDIAYGTSGHLVDASVLNTTLNEKQDSLEAGTGIEIVAGETTSTISVPITDVETLIDGTTATKMVDVAALRGALTTGQAVDVTSAPDGVTGDYLGSFTVTGSTLGFAAFPKYAKNLNYLFVATIVPTTTGTVTPSANCKWLDTGNRAAKSVTAGVSVKLAVTFTSSANTCPASFALSGTGAVTVSACRQYEVTACTAESIAYIASLSNPDAFADYYLLKADMVQPWTYIIDMGTSPAVTVAAGLSYKLNASTGTHTLTVDTCPVGYDGRDAIIRITLGGNGVVQAVAPLQLGGALVPYAINNCVVRFRDGEAVLLVEDTLAGYVVTVTSGTDSGSLAYGLAATGVPYIAFSTGTDGSVVDMGNAVTANEEVTVVGNGYTNTTVTGNITCTNKTTVANLGLQDVNVMGGTMTLGDAFIPSGSTVTVSGGGLSVERVTGAGGVIDLGVTRIEVPKGTPARADGVTFLNGYNEGCFRLIYSGGVLSATNCTFKNNKTVVAYYQDAQAYFTSCTFEDKIGTNTRYIFTSSTKQSLELNACTIKNTAGNVALEGTAKCLMTGSNVIETIVSGTTGSVILASGATLALTGNTNTTPIVPGGGITFATGGATVTYSSGTGSKSYMMDNVALPSGAKLTNTGEVNLGISNIVIPSGGTAYANDCVFINGSASIGGALNCSGSLVASNCIFSGNSASVRGGAFGVYGTAYLTGCHFANNYAVWQEYGRTGYVVGTLNISNCVFSNGQSIAMQNGGKVILYGSNSVDAILAAPNTSTGSVTLTSGAVVVLTGNTNAAPVTPGGKITFETGGATVTYTSGTGSKSYMMDNVTLSAGAKLTNTGAVNLGGTNLTFSSTTATIDGVILTSGSGAGGGIGATWSSHINVVSTTIANNSATGGGGGVLVQNSGTTVSIAGSTITGNVAVSRGGGIYNNGRTLHLTSTVITGNTATAGGGIMSVDGSVVTMTDCVVSGNTATSPTGIKGIYVYAGSAFTFAGSNVLKDDVLFGGGTPVSIAAGAIINLSGNPYTSAIYASTSGTITFGANVTIINSAGVSSLLNGGVAGSCSVIKKDGTIV